MRGPCAVSVMVTEKSWPGSGVTYCSSVLSDAATATCAPLASRYSDASRPLIDRWPCHV